MGKLTSEELEWAKNNPEMIRAVMKAHAEKKQSVELPLDPVEKAVASVRQHIIVSLGNIEKHRQETLGSLSSYTAYSNDENPRYRELGLQWLKENVNETNERFELYAKHEAALRDKLARLEASPNDCFLPLGTVVRFNGFYGEQLSTRGFDDRKSYPVKGSIGVVTRLGQRTDYFLGVSMRREYQIGWGEDIYCPDEDRLATFRVDPEMLDVLGYAKLPDGSEYHGYGFIETHTRKQPRVSSGDEREMILDADGFYWRFHDFGGDQGVECMQAFEDMSEMSWIKGPIPEFDQSNDASFKL